MSDVEVQGFRFDVAGFSEQGPRAENQDAYFVDGFAESSLLALADGMGGERSGRAAADMAISAISKAAPIQNVEAARRAVRDANEEITRSSDSNPDLYGGMGCALGFLSLANGSDGPGWIAAHVGDVRILSLSPDGLLRLETRDHTPAFARWEAGEISLDEIADSAGANRLHRAVGRGGEADVSWLPLAPGWSWVVVSDGIYKALRLDELAGALAGATAAEACETIRRKVAERGPDDNYTALIVRALGRPAMQPATARREQPMTSPSISEPARATRSAMAGVAMVAAVLALALAGFAVWNTYEAGAVRQAEVDALRTEVDSLRAVINRMTDPFGPSLPMDTPGLPGATQP